MNKYVWLKRGQNLSKTENNFTVLNGTLPKGIYRPVCDQYGNWSLECLSDEFTFPYKLYNINNDFINHVIKTWDNINNNLGIHLNGLKGTGKTVTGKIIANKTNLPVILIECSETQDPTPLVDYLKTIDVECVFFFDEYEKGFKDRNSILTLMDGMYSDLSRKMFILTTNERCINDNLVARPSRIRYFKEFNDIDINVLSNYIDDNLIDKSRKSEILKFLDQLKNCTIDIVKAVIEEINLHNCSINTIVDYMNLVKKDYEYRCIYIRRNDCDSIDEFIERSSKIGSSGEDRWGNYRTYLTSNDLGFSVDYICLFDKFENLKVGDYFDVDENIKILEIKDNFVKVSDDYDNIYYYKIENPNQISSIYKNSLSKFL